MRDRSTSVIGVICLVIVASAVVAESQQCPDANNMVVNCGFEVDTSSWGINADSFVRSTADARTGVASGEGNARTNTSGDFFFQILQCVSGVSPNTSYGGGVFFKLVSGAAAECSVELTEWTGSCNSYVGWNQSPYLQANTSEWTGSHTTFTTAPTTESVRVNVLCHAGSAGDFVMRLDDIYFGPGMVPVELMSLTVD